jgi:hypothetical protein
MYVLQVRERIWSVIISTTTTPPPPFWGAVEPSPLLLAYCDEYGVVAGIIGRGNRSTQRKPAPVASDQPPELRFGFPARFDKDLIYGIIFFESFALSTSHTRTCNFPPERQKWIVVKIHFYFIACCIDLCDFAPFVFLVCTYQMLQAPSQHCTWQ